MNDVELYEELQRVIKDKAILEENEIKEIAREIVILFLRVLKERKRT